MQPSLAAAIPSISRLHKIHPRHMLLKLGRCMKRCPEGILMLEVLEKEIIVIVGLLQRVECAIGVPKAEETRAIRSAKR